MDRGETGANGVQSGKKWGTLREKSGKFQRKIRQIFFKHLQIFLTLLLFTVNRAQREALRVSCVWFGHCAPIFGFQTTKVFK